MVILWQVVSGIFVPKIIKIWSLVFKLQSKMSGMFFLRSRGGVSRCGTLLRDSSVLSVFLSVRLSFCLSLSLDRSNRRLLVSLVVSINKVSFSF